MHTPRPLFSPLIALIAGFSSRSGASTYTCSYNESPPTYPRSQPVHALAFTFSYYCLLFSEAELRLGI